MNVFDFWRYREDHAPQHRDDAPVDAAWTHYALRAVPDPKPDVELQRELDEAREYGIERANEFRRQGRPGRALYEIARSVERQARVAGLGSLPVHPRSLSTDVAWRARP